MDKLPITEKESNFSDIDKMSTSEIISAISSEDATVAHSIQSCLPQIEILVEAIFERMKEGGRLFYIGSGTSGRLGIVDASECPPTFGVSHDLVIGIIAGGDTAIRKAVEFAEDNENQAWIDLEPYKPGILDTVIGIAASGTTPYVIGGINKANKHKLLTGCITCNPGSLLGLAVAKPVEVSVGPEFITGSTRMKSGTAQKMILNMISTALMVKMGRVQGNRMVNMQLTNKKLEDRGARMIMEALDIQEAEAVALLHKYGSVREAIKNPR
ncbi:MAG: N-acetylmuramic acid 6-phosphate etherase [Cyclobacteriaceae bacterium]|jgi:N-acetylmuramic acid 6-phosphate etherase